jgi:hypothetical protein
MAIPQPNLYTKKFQDILDEMLASIPKHTDKWTNYNSSDPGITILEMLAWVGDITLYRIDRIPEETYTSFLRLVAGAAGNEDVENLLNKPDLDRSHQKILSLLKEVENENKKTTDEINGAVLTFLSSRFRAITEEDFRELAIEATDFANSPSKVERAIVSADETKVEIIVVPDKWAEYEELKESDKNAEYNRLIKQVSDYLDPRRLIGTVVEVKKPFFESVNIEIKIVSSPYAKFENVREKVIDRIVNYLDPLVGGHKRDGWPYGRPLTVYEVAQVIEETEGVERTVSLFFDGDKNLTVKKTEGFIVRKEVNVTQEGI